MPTKEAVSSGRKSLPLAVRAEDFQVELCRRRQRIEEAFHSQREEFSEIERRLASRIASLTEQIEARLEESTALAGRQVVAHSDQAADLSRRENEINARSGELDQRRGELDEQQEWLDAVREELDAAREQLEREKAGFAREQDQLAAELAERERRAAEREQHTAQRERLATEHEQRLAQRVAELDESARQLERTEQEQRTRESARQRELEQLSGQLDRRKAELDEAAAALARDRAAHEESDRRRSEILDRQRGDLSEREHELDHRAGELAEAQRSLEAQQAELQRDRAAVRERVAGLERDRADLAAQRERLKEQRKSVADGLRKQKSQAQQEIQRRRQDGEHAAKLDADAALADARRELTATILRRDDLELELLERGEELLCLTGEAEAMRSELDRRRVDADQMRAELIQLRSQDAEGKLGRSEQALREAQARCASLVQEKAAAEQAAKQSAADLQSVWTSFEQVSASLVQTERELEQTRAAAAAAHHGIAPGGEQESLKNELVQRDEELALSLRKLRAAEQESQTLREELKAAQALSGGEICGDEQTLQELEDLKSRYAMAVDDLKEERRRAGELEKKLLKAQSAGGGSGPLDWEAQKRAMLASLDSDFDEDDADARRERMSLEEAIRVTDEAVAAKDREIDDLRRQMESSKPDESAAAASAVAEMLDKEPIIQNERAALQQLQEQWREKLRHAEVEVAQERAAIARQRQEYESKSRELEDRLSKLQRESGLPAEDEDDKKPGKRRWLARLGLRAGDDD